MIDIPTIDFTPVLRAERETQRRLLAHYSGRALECAALAGARLRVRSRVRRAAREVRTAQASAAAEAGERG
jgi:hypothetical protein